MPKIKNIIIFLAIGTAFVLIYIFFIKPSTDNAPTLISSGETATIPDIPAENADETITQDFLSLLLNVKNIRLNDAIFSDSAFASLHDSSIVLVQDGNEGRINPFAPIGNDVTTPLSPTCTPPEVLDASTNTCVSSSAN